MSETKKKRGFKKKRYTVPIIILVVLIAFRIYLPTLVKNNINKVLANIPGYYGQVDDVDISLYRGAYVINGMYLNKGTAESQIPFLSFPKNDISIEWKSLFKGKIVSEIIMTRPEVIYVFEDQKEKSGDANVDDWTKALTYIVPIDINHFEVHDGKVAFVQLSAEPNIDLQIAKLELTADNLRNVVEKERILPSRLRATGVSIGNGNVSLEANMNLMKEIPDMDLSFSLENAEATALNDFTNYYAGLDFNKGTFGLYSEIAIADGHLIGYVKPLLTNTKLIGKDDGFLEILWEGFAGFFKFILKNQSTDTLATKVPFEGYLNNVEAGVWPTVINIFGNAWIKAFTGNVDNEIEYKDAFKQKNLTREQKSELRKKEREQRKKERQIKKG
ncbi:DUF748 domain-containing protein [Aequorivita sp. F47161]|uniref:DUF748 domain-containing protein n=1 Tax=Aequorivita vitellina TaxID=2874475 RepID=A0A9X1U2N6_9FLAO|nr:DUF748 domain-containing protein [Aequorivita vitellina]MCG2420065.1 DUF748 domain-containing protein [Aequorivita vitellina]